MSFTGMVVELPIGQRGLSGTRNVSLLTAAHLTVANNITYADGTLRKEGGAAHVNSSPAGGSSSAIRAGVDWSPEPGTHFDVVVNDDGSVLMNSGSGDFNTTLDEGLSVGVDAMFLSAGQEASALPKKLFLFTGSHEVRVLDGDADLSATPMRSLTTPPADWDDSPPLFGELHNFRVWAGGNLSDPHRIYYSNPDDHDDFKGTGSGTFSVFPGEGERLVAAVSFRGVLVCFKYPTGVYVIDTRDPSMMNWTVNRLSGAIGVAWGGAITQVDNDLIFMDQVGAVRSISATSVLGDISSQSISDIADIQPLSRERFAFGRHRRWRAVWYPRSREAHFAVTSRSTVENDLRLVLDLNRREQPRFRLSERDTPVSMWTRINSDNETELMSGDDEGHVWIFDRDSRSKDDAGYLAEFATPGMTLEFADPNLGPMNKNGMFLEVEFEPQGAWTMDVDIYWDDQFHETITFDMGDDLASLGDFEIGTDKLSGGGALSTQKRRITGSGRAFGIRVKNDGVNQDFSIQRFWLHFIPGPHDKGGPMGSTSLGGL